MGFWPDDITVNDAISPRQIMESAGEELTRKTNVLSVDVRENILEDRIVLIFTVTNSQFSLAFNLFEASHRLDQTYPVVIEPPSSDIPEFLRRERYIPGQSGLSSILMGSTFQLPEALRGTTGTFVKNEWVSVTPTEFKEKLTKLFALDHVKTRIISLQAPMFIRKPSESGTPLAGSKTSQSENEPGGTNEREDELPGQPGETSE